MRVLVVSAVLCSLLGASEGYKTGAPEEACKTLEPNHDGAVRSPTPNPYNITAPSTAQPGLTVDVIVAGETFKGYMIQAVTEDGQVIGTFKGSTVACESPKDTATHSDAEPRTAAVLKWLVPNTKGHIVFRGTVVRDYNNYYINTYSNPMMVL